MAASLTEADRHYNNGVLYFNKNQRDKAVDSWDRALKADPRHFRTLVFKGVRCAQRKQGRKRARPLDRARSRHAVPLR